MQKEDIQAEVYGDRQKTKNKSSLRVLLQNIQRLPLSIRDQKHEDIVDWIHRDAGDIAILTEINTYWPKVPAHQQWEERSERLFPQGLKSRFSYNKTEKALAMFSMAALRPLLWEKPATAYVQRAKFTPD